jgi:diguanylate cyclase (GGDEF)-like protein
MTEESDLSGTARQPRAATRRLATGMLLALAAALVAMLAAELSIRYWIELPELYRIERDSDARNVMRLRNAMARRAEDLARKVRDYAAWDATYEFMSLSSDDERAAYFIETEIGPATYRNNQINGIVILDNDGRVVHSANISTQTGAPDAALELKVDSLDPRVFSRPGHQSVNIAAGIAPSSVGHVLFASARIVDTSEKLPPRGSILFWRLFDATELADISHLTGTRFTLIPIDVAAAEPRLASMLARAQERPGDFTPRDANGFVYWQLDDFAGRPAFLVRQKTLPRSFNPELFSPSTLVGFVCAGLVLLALFAIITRTVVDRVVRASATMRKIRETGAFHHRIPIVGDQVDELGEMFQHFNAMLLRLSRQEEDLREQNRRLAEMSQQDTLTGIPNRRALNENFDRFWRQAVRAKRPISVLMVDVDYFKPYNDRYGHLAGDRVLKQVAQTLQENLHRATDFVARYGGEEFCVILTETTLDHAVRVAEGLRKAVMDIGIRHDDAPGSGIVTISIGVASATANQTVVHLDLLRAADRALYRAKETGRNRVFHIEDDVTDPGRKSGNGSQSA